VPTARLRIRSDMCDSIDPMVVAAVSALMLMISMA